MRNKLYILLMLSIAFSFTNCDDYLDVNDNPNAVIEPPLAQLLTNVLYESGLNGFRVSTGFSSYYTQYLASPNEASPTDIYDDLSYSSAWGNLYGTMTDAYDVINLASENGSPYYAGVAQIAMAYNMGLLTATYGTGPYSQAFSGDFITPAYESEADFYQSMLNLLSEGISNLGASDNQVDLASGDIIFNGSTDQWVKLARGLEARLKNRFSRTSSYDAAGILAAVDAALASNDDNAALLDFTVRNPWAQVALDNENLLLDGWLSEQLIDAMNGVTFGVFDPRLPLITNSFIDTVNGVPTEVYRGTTNGEGRRGDGVIQEECYISTDGFYSQDDSPLMMMTYAEVKFIEAEAAWRGAQLERSYNAFLDGIGAHMQMLGITDEGDISAYINAAYPNLSMSNIALDDIFREKYIAMFLDAEAWVDARRFDYQYQDFTRPTFAEGSDFIRRVRFPDSELTTNGSNVPTVTSVFERLYWDQ